MPSCIIGTSCRTSLTAAWKSSNAKATGRDRPNITQKDIPRLYPPGSEIIVQVTKGPIGTKGPRVTTNLVLPGRYLVLLPNSDQSGISRKIENQEERQRLKKILRELAIPDGMGVIMRTAGEGQQKRYFVRDLALLLEEWHGVQERSNRNRMATCVFQEPDLIERTVRDFLTEDVERIVVDKQKAYDRMREMISKISTRAANKVKLYADAQPVFDRFNITSQLENAFSRQVHLKSGGYIVIDETEALVAIDVNTGRHKGSRDQESTILRVNLEAAEEICRQLRLRNMGGLIVLDFIDMKSRRDQQQVYQRMKEGLRRDKAKTHVLPISQLGLMEMTRQRHSESVRAAVYDDCPYCKGRGKVKSVVTMSVEIQRKLHEILKKRTRDESDFQLRIVVHPTVLERLRTEDEKLSSRWRNVTSANCRSGAETGIARRTVQDRERGEQRGTGERRSLKITKVGLRCRAAQIKSGRCGSTALPKHTTPRGKLRGVFISREGLKIRSRSSQEASFCELFKVDSGYCSTISCLVNQFLVVDVDYPKLFHTANMQGMFGIRGVVCRQCINQKPILYHPRSFKFVTDSFSHKFGYVTAV